VQLSPCQLETPEQDEGATKYIIYCSKAQSHRTAFKSTASLINGTICHLEIQRGKQGMADKK
jgi:hypothetical protein